MSKQELRQLPFEEKVKILKESTGQTVIEYLKEVLEELTITVPTSHCRHYAYRRENNNASTITGSCLTLSQDKYSSLDC